MEKGIKVKIFHRPITFVDYKGTSTTSEVSGAYVGDYDIGSRKFIGVKADYGKEVTLIWEHDIIFIKADIGEES